MNNDSVQEEDSIITINSDVIYQQDKAQIDVQISTAKLYPRNPARATKNAVDIVSLDIDTAVTCTYAVPRGGKSISGPSVHLAKILAQCWGNLRMEAKVVEIGDTQITSEGVCFDLENNIAIKTQVKRSIMTKTGRMSQDMIVVTGNAANSIALRNAILSVIPRPVTDKAYNAAKQVLTGDVSDATRLKARVRQVVDALMSAYDVSEVEVLASIGRASIDHVTADNVAELVGIGTAIKDNDTTVEQAFRREKTATAEVKESEEIKRAKDLIAKADSLDKLMSLADSFPPEIAKNEAVIKDVDAKAKTLRGE